MSSQASLRHYVEECINHGIRPNKHVPVCSVTHCDSVADDDVLIDYEAADLDHLDSAKRWERMDFRSLEGTNNSESLQISIAAARRNSFSRHECEGRIRASLTPGLKERRCGVGERETYGSNFLPRDREAL
ncbi:hypothetical protein Hypma_011880 [Hypsizygus marmoreus]|uniref:Uncharacterized protein n=1 Tax=Hypsizygus marmoreus TaxID=39966 RepID=A0A369JH03_HYPMA|nr:hypothetical protein Hypma_011880 [Hypsizygus marmoreus]